MIKFSSFKSDIILGVVLAGLALAALFIWIPLDIDTGLVERVRRRNIIGDSLGPTAAMILLGLSALFLMREGRTSKPVETPLKWLAIFAFYVIIFLLSLLIMRFAGPFVIGLADRLVEAELSYRPLRNVWPLKYVGFVGGGWLLLCALSHFMDSKLSRKRAALFLGITILIALFFDLPFEDILLPPNGDV